MADDRTENTLYNVTMMESITLEQTLQETWARARSPWPMIHLPVEQYLHHLAEKWPEPRENRQAAEILPQLHHGDLYLACACMHRIAGAVEALEKHYFTRLTQLLGRKYHSSELIDEVLQRVREKLLVSRPEEEPKISQYSGEGTLLSFLQVAAFREAYDLQHRHKPPETNEGEVVLEALAASGSDPDLTILMSRYREEFLAALHTAFAALDEAAQTLLRLRYVDRLSLPKIGALYGVHHTTILRQLTRAQDDVYQRTKAQLKVRLTLSSQEFDSLITSLRSHLDLSLSWILTPPTQAHL